MPAMYHNEQQVEAGVLMFYGVSRCDLDRQAATFLIRF